MQAQAKWKTFWVVAAAVFAGACAAHAKDSSAEEAGRIQRGIELASERRFDEAALEFNEVIKADPGNSEAHFQLGILYYYVKKNKDAAIA